MGSNVGLREYREEGNIDGITVGREGLLVGCDEGLLLGERLG